MAVINTTNVIDNSIYLKNAPGGIKGNMVGDNYYIENLQDKRNADWEYRYNRVDIEEELRKQIIYTTEQPNYTPIDAVITNVKSDKGEDLGTDWAHLAFKDLKHPNNEGSRYRFSLDFPDMNAMTEEDKHYNTSIWICVNKSPIKAGNSCTVRRCDTTLTFLGYENRDRRKTSTREIHYEPVILETELRYLQVYYNMTMPVPQAEWYAICQLNYFTDCVKINDRFLFGTMDTEVRENNASYKVKAVIKATTEHTFVRDKNDEMESTPLVVFALDKDAIAPKDNFKTRVAVDAPVYNIPKVQDEGIDVEVEEGVTYTMEDASDANPTINLGKYVTYGLVVKRNGEIVINPEIVYTYNLEGVEEKDWDKYFKFKQINSSSFRITNLKTYNKGKLKVVATFNIPEKESEQLIREYTLTLGKVY